MQQLVDIHVPATEASSVGDTLRYVLLHSGYRLCDDPTMHALDDFPLPAAHIHLGPLPLASTLQLLVGREWELRVDEGDRRVCFALGSTFHPADADAPPQQDIERPVSTGVHK
jgi:type IV pili sensor histidine kinase/response regulator